jgi:hypothetical protein
MAAGAETRLVVGLDERVPRVIGRVGVDAERRYAEGSADPSPPAGSAGVEPVDVVEVQQCVRHP